MIDAKEAVKELEMLKSFCEGVVDGSTSVAEINVYKGCIVAVDHAIQVIEDQEERIAIMSENELYCKDCKFWNDEKARDNNPSWLPCMAVKTRSDFYCADGERKGRLVMKWTGRRLSKNCMMQDGILRTKNGLIEVHHRILMQ